MLRLLIASVSSEDFSFGMIDCKPVVHMLSTPSTISVEQLSKEGPKVDQVSSSIG